MQLRSLPTIAGLCVLAALGCRTPPAAPSACGPAPVQRRSLFARQVAIDTAATAAAHPIRSSYASLTGPLAYLRAWTAGLAEKRIGLKLLGPPPPICADRPTLDPADLERRARRVSREPPSPADVKLLIDGHDARDALFAVIESATFRLDVIMYLWGDDAIGREIAERLAAKASPKLPVRVLIDGGGNLTQGEPKDASAQDVNRTVCWLAEQPCVTVLRIRDPFFRLDHRKLLIADGRLAWTGGRNFVDDAFFLAHDLSYTVSGPLAGQMADVFEQTWRQQGGRRAEPLPAGETLEPPNAMARVVRTTPARREFARVLYEVVERAEHHVYAENPYLSDNHLIALFGRARSRGADVRVVLTLDSASSIYDRSNRVTANRLLAAGVRVYLYPGRLHAKVLAVDGVWAYTGTGNFDNLSLRHNRELGLAINDGPVIRELEERVFLPDFQPDWELTEPLPVDLLDYLYEFVASTFS